MENKKLPFKIGIILLSIFQIYTILTRWNEDTQGTIIASIILIGCIFLLLIDVFFKNSKQSD